MKIDLERLRNRKINICDNSLYTEFSVLVPLVESAGSYSLLFEVRAESLKKQPNEICFPGGKIEKSENPQQAAVRETSEELLLPESKIEVFGELDTLVTPFNTLLYPFTGRLKDYRNSYNHEEVKETFLVPLSFLIEAEPACHYIDVQMTPGDDFPYEMIQEGSNYPWKRGKYPVYFYVYENRIIWGITARIIKSFIELIKNQ